MKACGLMVHGAFLVPDDTIVIKVPAGTKARWVHKSQSEGVKLSEWIARRVDVPANKMARDPCPRCSAVLLVADGPDYWQCAQCGLAS